MMRCIIPLLSHGANGNIRLPVEFNWKRSLDRCILPLASWCVVAARKQTPYQKVRMSLEFSAEIRIGYSADEAVTNKCDDGCGIY